MRAALALAASIVLAGLAGCAQQDAAIEVTFKGAYRIPTDGDTLVVDVREGTGVIKHVSYSLAAQAAPPSGTLGTLTFVESGAEHATLRIDGVLTLQGQTVGLGRIDTAFQAGKTVQVTLTLVPPQ